MVVLVITGLQQWQRILALKTKPELQKETLAPTFVLKQKVVLALTHKTYIIGVILFSYIFCILTCFLFSVTTVNISVSPGFHFNCQHFTWRLINEQITLADSWKIPSHNTKSTSILLIPSIDFSINRIDTKKGYIHNMYLPAATKIHKVYMYKL